MADKKTASLPLQRTATRATTASVPSQRESGTATGMPSFVVIGAQKSASTFLQDQLSLHPDIEIPDGEVRAFEDPYYEAGAVDELPTLFRRPIDGVARGIKRPGYLGHPEVPARLHRHLPDAKLFAVIREPVARAVSSYYHLVRHGFLPLAPIDDAFAALLDDKWATQYPRSGQVLSFGLYGEQLKRYLDLYPADQLMVLEQSHLIKEPRSSLRRAFELIGVDPDFTVAPQRIAVSNKGVYSPIRLRLLRAKNRTKFRYAPGLDHREARKLTPWGWLYNAAIVGVDRTVLARFDDGRPPALSPAMRERVAAYYDKDSELLREVLAGRDVHVGWL